MKETKSELNEPKPQKAEKENTTPKETHKRKIEEGAFPDKGKPSNVYSARRTAFVYDPALKGHNRQHSGHMGQNCSN